MTKYVAEILKQLGIYYEDYGIQNHRDEESGEVWITLHPNKNCRELSSLGEKVNTLHDSMYGKYKVYWDENSCYLNIVGIIEIGVNGKQLYPIPMRGRPALFTQDYILDLWNNNREHIPNT